MKKIIEKEFFWIVLLLGFSFILVSPILKKGFYPFHDESHIANLYQMVRAISSGQIPPRWAPDFSFNYGYPFFNFNYLLPFYVGAFFNLALGLSLVWSLKIVFALSVPLSALAFYKLGRKFSTFGFSFFAAMIYCLAPYRAVDLYVRGAVGELWGFVFMPLVLLSFINLIEKKSFKRVIFAGLSLAGLIISHSLTTVIFMPFAGLFLFAYILLRKDKIRSVVSSLLGAVLGLSLSAYYWLPAFLEKKLMQPGTPFNPFDHFPFIKQLIIPSWGYGASVWGPGDGMSFQIGIINIFLILFSLFLLLFFRKKTEKLNLRLFFVSLALFFLSLFLMNIRSGFIWSVFPLGEYVQFPWRFLIVSTFFSSLSLVFVEKTIGLEKKAISKYGILIFIFFAFFINKPYFKPEKKVFTDDDYFLKRFFVDRISTGKSEELSQTYFSYSEDYLPLPVWVEERPGSLPEEKIEITGGELFYREISPVKYEIVVKTKEAARVFVNNYYYPGWTAQINGREVPINIEKPYGNMSFEVLPGESSVVMLFKETPFRLIADLISLSSFLFSVLALLLIKKAGFRK
ncbi:hypothetical protein KKA69_00235 [Patescibacteria group bacterium]|nr:hypothetical protein [Patescibacteria group bacterium]